MNHGSVRNVFDQYKMPENRLSHALATSLAEEPKLLKSFLQEFLAKGFPNTGRFVVAEQHLPGEAEAREESTDDRGIPDICIFHRDEWILAIESKIEAALSLDQLRRHQHTLERRGFKREHVKILTITACEPPRKPASGIVAVQWKDVYDWSLRESRRFDWARRLARYIEVAESRFATEGYMKNVSLVQFAGIPFGEDHPYSDWEARQVVRLTMSELRKRSDLRRKLGIDTNLVKHLTGTWDILQLAIAKKAGKHTDFPHLTFGIWDGSATALLIIPNAVRSSIRRNLVEIGSDRFRLLCEQVLKRLHFILRQKGEPYIQLYQRHFRSMMGSSAVDDARIWADLRCILPSGKGRRYGSKIKYQPEWIDSVYRIVSQKRSNMELSFCVGFSYDDCPALRDRKSALELIAQSWIAFKPVLDVLMRNQH